MIARVAFALSVVASTAAAQAAAPADTAADRKQVAAIVDSALAAISRSDMAALTGLMVDEAVTFSVRTGAARHSSRTRAAWLTNVPSGKVTERAFGIQVSLSGPIAMAWAPYDLYINDAWSHCGVDVFTLVKTAGTWKISTLAWSVEQPPACAKHPDGPPRK
jgi:ketosteroid isomerase-like protein